MSEAVVIAGAGPVGLALALGLARRGVRTIVLEKKTELSRHSKAVVVLPRTLEILNEWQVIDGFKATGEWIERLVPVGPGGRPILHLDFTSLRSRTATAAVCVLPQNETERLLFGACRQTGLVDIRFDHEVVAFDASDSGVRVRARGPDGQHVFEADYLCGCDGAHSVIREGLGLKLEGKTYDAHAILADVEIADDRDALSWPRVDFSQPGLNAALRFRPGRWRLVLAYSGPPPTGDGDEIDPEFLRSKVDQLIGAGPVEILWSSGFKIHCRNAPHFRVGPILLVGDAAHLNSPAGGQGMNGGIQDAHNLAWKLALALRGGHPDLLLSSYDEERYDAITHGIDVTTDRLTRFGILLPPWVRRLALLLVGWMSRFRKTEKRIAAGMGMLNYRYDMSVLIDRSGGMLLPDIDLGDGVRLRSMVGLEGGLVEVVQNGAKVTVGESTFDLSHEASQELSRAGGPFIAVRPDAVVAYSGGSREEAADVLAKIMVKA